MIQHDNFRDLSKVIFSQWKQLDSRNNAFW